MRRFPAAVIVMLILFPAVCFAADWEIVTGFGADAATGGLGLHLPRNYFVTLESGIAWERNADLRPDDMLIKNTWYLPVFTGKRINLRLAAAAEMYIVNTGYARFAAPGGGFGFEFDAVFLKRNSLYIETGVQLARQRINSEYHGSLISVYYSEIWQAPLLYAQAGWRFRL